MSDTVGMTKNISYIQFTAKVMSCCNTYQANNESQTSDGGGQTVCTMPLKLAPTLTLYLT